MQGPAAVEVLICLLKGLRSLLCNEGLYTGAAMLGSSRLSLLELFLNSPQETAAAEVLICLRSIDSPFFYVHC